MIELSRRELFFLAEDSLELASRFMEAAVADSHEWGEDIWSERIGYRAGHLFRAREIFSALAAEVYPGMDPAPWLDERDADGWDQPRCEGCGRRSEYLVELEAEIGLGFVAALVCEDCQ